MTNRAVRQLEHLKELREGTAAVLRMSFKSRGFDVEQYADEELSRAILDEAIDDASEDLLARAFARLDSWKTPAKRAG
jgi:4'-phosphopantetheinyl transferase EntD